MNVTTLLNLEDTPKSLPLFLYGSISCGADTWSVSLGKGRQVFSCDDRLRSKKTLHRSNYHRTKWSKYPNLDLLLVCMDNMDDSEHGWMKDWGYPNRSKNILVLHGLQALTSCAGKGYKSWCKLIRGRGYQTHTWHVNAVHCGASVYSRYIATFCYPQDSSQQPYLLTQISEHAGI